MINIEDVLQKERELRSAAWWLPAGFDTTKGVMFSAADLLAQVAAQQARTTDPLPAVDDGINSDSAGG